MSTVITFDEFIKNCTQQFNELSTNSSLERQQLLEKIDQLLELLRSVHSKEPPLETLSESNTSITIIPSDFTLNAPLSDQHLKWFDLIQKVLIHKCETLLHNHNKSIEHSLLHHNNDDNNHDHHCLSTVQDFILHELAPLHEWMKRKCLTIMSDERIAPQQRYQVQEKFLKKSMNDWELCVGPLLEKLSNLMIEQEYQMEIHSLLKEGQDNVTVKYKNKEEGKIVALCADKVQNGQVLFKEEPICSQVITDSSENPFYSKIDHCHHCMKTIFSDKTIQQFPFIGQLMKDEECKEILLEKLTTAKTFVPCDHCSVVTYCCEFCKQKSWNEYHSVLCCRNQHDNIHHNNDKNSSGSGGSSSSTEKNAATSSSNSGKTTDHPMILLERLTIKQQRTAPLLIAKIMATVFTDFIRRLIKDKSDQYEYSGDEADNIFMMAFSKSLHRFERFVQHEEPHPFDSLAVQLIKESIEYAIEDGYLLGVCDEKDVKEYLTSHSQQISQVVILLCNLKQYRSLHGLILQNCSTIHPITELHLAAHEHIQIRNKVCELLHCNNFEEQATRTETLQSLSMKGMGAFAIHNCMNHSCIPNAISVSDYITHQVTVYASINATSTEKTRAMDNNIPNSSNSTNDALNTTTAVLSKGDEVLISYIDEHLPNEERRKKLKEQYRFDCHCPKCSK